MSMSGSFGIEDDGQVGGLRVFDDIQQGLGKDENGGGVEAFGIEHGPLDQGEVSPVDESHAIQEK